MAAKAARKFFFANLKSRQAQSHFSMQNGGFYEHGELKKFSLFHVLGTPLAARRTLYPEEPENSFGIS